MSSSDGKGHDGDDALESSPNTSTQPSIQAGALPMGYPNMPMHMYPFPPGLLPPQPLRSKRRQVKNACTNCQKACKKCDDARPCLRCVKYGISDECVDSQRKERKKGIKRGPYKKRDGKDRTSIDIDQPNMPQQSMSVPMGIPPPMAGSPMGPSYVMGLPGYYGQYAHTAMPKPGDSAPGLPYYILPPSAQQPPPLHGVQEGDSHGYQPQPFYSTYVTPYPPPVAYPSYMVHRPDGYMPTASHYSAVYSAPMYSKYSTGGSGEMVNGGDQVSEGQEGAVGDK